MADPAQGEMPQADADPVPAEPQPPAGDKEHGLYPTMPGIRWIPLYPQAGARAESTALAQSRRGFKHGLIAAGIVLAAVTLLALLYRDASVVGTLIGVGGAVAAGVFMVAAGMGMLAGEALQAAEPKESAPPALRRLGPDDVPASISSVYQGLQGLTTARAAIFAGALLLAVAAIGGGISTAGSDGAGDSDSGTSTTAPATSTGPSATSTP